MTKIKISRSDGPLIRNDNLAFCSFSSCYDSVHIHISFLHNRSELRESSELLDCYPVL